jgi:hypothetical protein
MYLLSTDTGFQNRVRAAIEQAAVGVANEGWAVPFHRERATFAAQILNTPTGGAGGPDYTVLFARAMANDPNIVAGATENGTVVLTTGNLAAQAALVSDAAISNAISACFNSFFRVPGN